MELIHFINLPLSSQINEIEQNEFEILPFFHLDYLSLNFRREHQAEFFLQTFEEEFKQRYGRPLFKVFAYGSKNCVVDCPDECKIEVAFESIKTLEFTQTQLKFNGLVAHEVFTHITKNRTERHVRNIKSICRLDARLNSSFLLEGAQNYNVKKLFIGIITWSFSYFKN